MKTCKEAFEKQFPKGSDFRRKHGQYVLQAVQIVWLDYRAAWRACGEQALELYGEWAADSVGSNLKMQLKALAKGGDDGESQER